MSSVDLGGKITRFEVIDESGRVYVNAKVTNVELSLQDKDRTLKIFIKSNDDKAEKR